MPTCDSSSSAVLTQSFLSPFSPSVPLQPPLSGMAPPLASKHSPSTRHPGSCECPSSSLDSSSNRRAFGLAGLPWYIGSAWVGHRSTFPADLRAVRCPPPLHLRLAPPSLRLHLSPWSLRIRVVAEAPSRPPTSSGSLRFIGSPATRWAPPPMSPLPPVVAMVSSGCLPPWLLPPWSAVLFGHWDTICLSVFRATRWISPPSAPPWTLLFGPLPVVRPPAKPLSICRPIVAPSRRRRTVTLSLNSDFVLSYHGF